MKAKVGIGITAYSDLSTASVGASIFDTYERLSARSVPNRMSNSGVKIPVNDRASFSTNWVHEIAWEVRDKPRGTRGIGNLVERSIRKQGSEWRRVGGLPGEGRLDIRSYKDPNGPDQIEILQTFSPVLDWLGFFDALIEVSNPAHAMLDVFSGPENLRDDIFVGEVTRPYAGEGIFSRWKTATGAWHRPDPWRLEERRQYRFLPDLAWATHLGPEFFGRYDAAYIQAHAASCRSIGGGLRFTLTDSIEDAANNTAKLAAKREELKAGFTGVDFGATPLLN